MEMPEAPADRDPPSSRRLSTGEIAARCAVFAVLWIVLTGGRPDAWVVGVPAVLLAVAASGLVGLRLPWPGSFTGAVRFVPFFLWRALIGGVDVARRVVDPRLPIAPGMVPFELRLPAGPPCVLLANCLSLLPGTLAARLEGRRLLLHVIDTGSPVDAAVRRAERAVADLLGIELEGERHDDN